VYDVAKCFEVLMMRNIKSDVIQFNLGCDMWRLGPTIYGLCGKLLTMKIRS
jgi:hypothetical protein